MFTIRLDMKVIQVSHIPSSKYLELHQPNIGEQPSQNLYNHFLASEIGVPKKIAFAATDVS